MILAFKSRLRGKSLLLWEDNQGVVGILKKLCTKSQAMMADLHDIMVLLLELNLILRVRYVALRNNSSDYFSRIHYKGEWLLDLELAHLFMRSHETGGGGVCTMDRFADGLSAILPALLQLTLPVSGQRVGRRFLHELGGRAELDQPTVKPTSSHRVEAG
jgi:hypothetical protein